MLCEDWSGPFDGFMNDELFDGDRFTLFVTMKEIALFGRQTARARCFPKKVDDVALSPEFTIADRMQADCLLQRDYLPYRIVFDLLEVGSGDQLFAMLLARF